MGLQAYDEPCFNDDMVAEILIKLPLKSFSRSKCVSKTWQALLSDDYLRSKLPLIVSGVIHPSNPSLKNKPTYVSNLNSNVEPTSLDFFPFLHDSNLVDCSNGLLLFYSSLAKAFYVCNPTTRKYVTLPRPSRENRLSILAFDPCHSKHFKVVNITGFVGHGATVELFDSQHGKWIEHNIDWGLDANALSSIMRYMDGVLYIVAQPKQVVAVDMCGAMACRVIELPEVARVGCCIGVVGGRFHYSVNDGNKMRIWMLGDVGKGEWVLKHNVCVGKEMGEIRVLGLHPESDNVVYLRVEGKLVCYDVLKGRVEEVWEVGKEEKGSLTKIWVFPFSRHMEACLAW